MRNIVVALLLAAGVLPVTAAAQSAPRAEVGPIVRMDRVSFEGRASGVVPVAGVGVTVMITRIIGIAGEFTVATSEVEHSYEGWFVSAAGPGASREEIERLAPTARRTRRFDPGGGGAVALVLRGHISTRVRMGASVGMSARRYTQTSRFQMLTVPAGIDQDFIDRNFRTEVHERTRGGLLLGVNGAVSVTDRLTLTPEVRFVYGGPAQVGNNYREAGFGLRAGWSF